MIFIAVGSSIGKAEDIFENAIKFLKTKEINVTRQSKILKNPPSGGVAQNEFSNAVWEIEIPNNMTPQELLPILKSAEKNAGRDMNAPRWSDRALDLDIIIFHDQIIQEEKLKIPHPRMIERDFVMKPLGELVDENYQIPNLGPLKEFI